MIATAALKAEILADPDGLGYGPYVDSGADWLIAKLLNAPSPRYPVLATSIGAEKLIAAIRPKDFPADPAAQAYLTSLAQLRGSVPVDQAFVDNMDDLFAATASWPRIKALLIVDGSRAQHLWGPGVSVDHAQVAECFAAERKQKYDLEQAPVNAAKDTYDTALHRYTKAQDAEARLEMLRARQALKLLQGDDS